MKKMLFATILVLLLISPVIGQTPQSLDGLKSQTAETSRDTITVPGDPAASPVIQKAFLSRKLRKSTKKAFFLSLLVPGSGEYYVGRKAYSKGFIASEVLIWSAALFNKFKGDMWRRDYISYAAQQSGSNPGRTDDPYYEDLYEWSNSDWYNEDQWRQAIALYPYDPAAQQAYVAGKLYSEEDSWEWLNYDQWHYYKGLRVKSRNALHRISYSFGAAVLNHVFSAVNAARLAKRYNREKAVKLTLENDWRLECSSYRPETITLAFLRNF